MGGCTQRSLHSAVRPANRGESGGWSCVVGSHAISLTVRPVARHAPARLPRCPAVQARHAPCSAHEVGCMACSDGCRPSSPALDGTARLPPPPPGRHTVCYDDGEVGMHRLWQHDERIRLASPVEQWPRDAALARQRLAAAQERLRSRDQGRRALVRLAGGGSTAGRARASFPALCSMPGRAAAPGQAALQLRSVRHAKPSLPAKKRAHKRLTPPAPPPAAGPRPAAPHGTPRGRQGRLRHVHSGAAPQEPRGALAPGSAPCDGCTALPLGHARAGASGGWMGAQGVALTPREPRRGQTLWVVEHCELTCHHSALVAPCAQAWQHRAGCK